MSILQKNNTQFQERLPLLSDRTNFKNFQKNIHQMHYSFEKQHKNFPLFIKTSRNQLNNQSHRLKTLRKQFMFLHENSEIMHKSFNYAKYLQNVKKVKKKCLQQEIIKSQIKLDKDKKQQWSTLHKRIVANLDKTNQLQQRRIYKSRTKLREENKEIFTIRQVGSKCFKGTFPISRLNAVMTSFYDKSQSKYRIFLIGGQSTEMTNKIHFHQYIFATQTWKPIQSDSPYPPQFNLSQHVLLNYQKNIFIIGGIAVFTSSCQNKNQRYNIPFISCFNLKTYSWNRINWNVYLRAHAAASFGNYGIIDGGIMEDNKNSGKIYIFDMSKLESPILVNPNSSIKLSHHKMVSTQAFQDKGKYSLKIQGLICFGGKKQDDQINQKTYFMNFDVKYNDFADKIGKIQWILLQTKGKSPKGRYMHSMNLLQTKTNIFQRKAYCAVLGGIGQNQNILNDYWLLDLITLQWCQIIFNQNTNLILQNGIAGHCSITMKNQILIFGGYDSTREHISKFWSISCENGLKIDKKMYKIRKQQQ